MAFFHRKASQRFWRNQIDGLRNQMGEMCSGENNVANIIINYYHSLFTTSNPCEIDSVLQFVPQVVTNDMNNMLFALHQCRYLLSKFRGDTSRLKPQIHHTYSKGQESGARD